MNVGQFGIYEVYESGALSWRAGKIISLARVMASTNYVNRFGDVTMERVRLGAIVAVFDDGDRAAGIAADLSAYRKTQAEKIDAARVEYDEAVKTRIADEKAAWMRTLP